MKIKLPTNYNPHKDGITQSLLQNFMLCPTKGLLAANGYYLPEREGKTAFGSICHAVLEQAYRAPDAFNLNRAILTSVKNENAFREEETREFLEVKAQSVLSAYLNYNKKDLKRPIFFDTEKIFNVDFFNYKLRGKIDLVFGKTKNDVWLVDHKFWSQIPEDTILDSLTLDFQVLFYFTALTLINGVRPKGVLYNVIRNPAHRLNKNENLIGFGERLSGLIAEKPEHFFKRYEVKFSQEIVDTFQTDLKIILQKFCDTIQGKTPAYKNVCACIGKYPCEFLRICSTHSFAGYKTKPLFEELK